MTSDFSGDVSDFAYTFDYFRELSPAFLSLVALNNGVAFDADRPLRYLELGFGHGVSLGVHAAANDGEYWGNDINPQHVAFAGALNAASGAKGQVLIDSFEDLLARQDVPQFDVIALHGIWTWVGDADRENILEIARRYLAPGGLLYVSYNCYGGWGASVALRELLRLHAEREGSPDAPMAARIDGAIAFAKSIAAGGANYFKVHPRVVAQLLRMEKLDRAYLTQEFFGSNWALSSLAEVVGRASEADLHYVGTTAFLLNDESALGPEGAAVSAGITDPVLRQTVRDSFANTQFRQDVFVKGEPKRLSAEERLAQLRERAFALTAPARSVPRAVPGPRVELALPPNEYGPIIAALAADAHAPKSIASLQAQASERDPQTLLRRLLTLIGAGVVEPVNVAEPTADIVARCAALNAHLRARAEQDGAVGTLASPVLGAGVNVGRLVQLVLLAKQRGAGSPAAVAQFVHERMRNKGAPPLPDLQAMAAGMERDLMPILRALRIGQV